MYTLRLGVDPCGLACFQRCKARLDRLEDFLLGVELRQCLLLCSTKYINIDGRYTKGKRRHTLKTFEENPVANF